MPIVCRCKDIESHRATYTCTYTYLCVHMYVYVFLFLLIAPFIGAADAGGGCTGQLFQELCNSLCFKPKSGLPLIFVGGPLGSWMVESQARNRAQQGLMQMVVTQGLKGSSLSGSTL